MLNTENMLFEALLQHDRYVVCYQGVFKIYILVLNGVIHYHKWGAKVIHRGHLGVLPKPPWLAPGSLGHPVGVQEIPPSGLCGWPLNWWRFTGLRNYEKVQKQHKNGIFLHFWPQNDDKWWIRGYSMPKRSQFKISLFNLIWPGWPW